MKRFLRLLLVMALLTPFEYSLISGANAAVAKAGGTCTKLNSTSTVNGYKFTCVKSGKKLVWSKGVKVVIKATPTPTPTSIDYELSIELTENNETNFTSNTDNIGYCNNGGARYKDISATTQVEIRDGSGKLLATGVLGSAQVVYLGGPMANCIFNPIIKFKKSDFYQVKIGNRYNASFSFTELVNQEWKIKLSIG